MKTLNCFYDMAVSPCSYDFFTFLFSAELCRVRRKLDNIKLIIVHGPRDLFREDNIRTNTQNKTFFENVIIPGITLLPFCDSFMWMRREDLNVSQIDPTFVFPRGYTPQKPEAEYIGNDLVSCRVRGDTPSFLRAPEYARDFAKNFIGENCKNKPVITLTTREISRDNKNDTRSIITENWERAFESLSVHFSPIIIRDSFSCHKPPLMDGIMECPQASLHLPFRMALYEQAIMNFSKNTGPALLLFYGKTNATYYNAFDEDVVAVSKGWAETNYGITKGGQYPMTTTSKQYCWESETIENISKFAKNANSKAKDSLQLNGLVTLEDLTFSVITATKQLIKNLRFNLMREDVGLYLNIKKLAQKNNIHFDLDENLHQLSNQMFPAGTVETLVKEAQKNS